MIDPLPSTTTSGEPSAYQPISGWAIAGFGVGSLFALLVAVSTLVALVQGVPFFFPLWIVSLAVLGVVLSVIGMRHVQNSEGTRAGTKLAQFGLWLSLVSGLGYLSYFFVTGLALQAQADAFLMIEGPDAGFFPHLRKGATDPVEFNAAYLLTLPATARSGRPNDLNAMMLLHDSPGKDGTPGNLTQFKEGILPRLFFKQLAKDVEITALGLEDWRYELKSYKIHRRYRIKTQEVETTMRIAVYSTEPEAAGQERKWFVNVRESYPIANTVTYSPLGKGIALLRSQAQTWLTRWGATLNEGWEYPEIKDKDQSDWNLVFIREGNRDKVRATIHEALTRSDRNRLAQFKIYPNPNEIGKWEIVDGKVRVYHGFRFALMGETAGPPLFFVDGLMVVETKKPLDPAAYDANSPPADWVISRIVFTHISTPTPDRKGP